MRQYFTIRFDDNPYRFSFESDNPPRGGSIGIEKGKPEESEYAVVFEHGSFPALGRCKEIEAFGEDLKRLVLAPRSIGNLEAGVAATLSSIASQIRGELDSGQPGSRSMAAALAVQFMTILSRATAAPASQSHGEVWSIRDSIEYIEENYTDAFTLDFFVSKCALNVSDFSRRFKEQAGCPLFEFIHRQRIKHACSLLKSSDMPIIDVSFAVGYNNLSFFNRYFLRIMGISPRTYRQTSG